MLKQPNINFIHQNSLTLFLKRLKAILTSSIFHMSKDAYIIISCNNQAEIILMNFGGKLQTILYAAILKGNGSFGALRSVNCSSCLCCREIMKQGLRWTKEAWEGPVPLQDSGLKQSHQCIRKLRYNWIRNHRQNNCPVMKTRFFSHYNKAF